MWRVTAERRGTTLVEVLIYAALFVFILGAIYGSLTMGLNAYRRTDNFATVQHQALTGLRQLTDELASAPRAKVGYETNAVVFPSARDGDGQVHYDGSGNVLWQAWVTYYVETGRGLVRSRLAFTPATQLPTTIPTSNSVRSDGSATQKLAANSVEALSFTPGNATEVTLLAANDLWDRTSVQVKDRVCFRQ